MICEYGCGQEANFQLKNKKWCCCKNTSQCPFIRKKISEINKIIEKSSEWKQHISESKKGKPAWNKDRNDYVTNEMKMEISKKNKGKIAWNKDKTGIYSEETLKLMSDAGKRRKGVPNLGKRLSIKQINKKYPTFCKEEEMRYNPDKPIEEKEIQVHCKNHNCENSKEKGGWFAPTYIQLYERIRQIENGNGGSYLYCSQYCKDTCPLYGIRSDPFRRSDEIYRELQTELRQMRFAIDNYTCQICKKHQTELKVELHCHHREGIRWEPIESADIDKVITLCKTCHLEVHKKEGCGYDDMKCKKGERIT